jgi:integrase
VSLDSRTVILRDTKNGDSREVPLSSAVVAALQDWKKRTAVVSITGKVFQITPHAISVAFRRATRRARKLHDAEYVRTVENSDPSFLLGLRFHDLRHEAVSRLFEQGFNVMEVAAISGHRTLQMLKRYTHLKAVDLARRLG